MSLWGNLVRCCFCLFVVQVSKSFGNAPFTFAFCITTGEAGAAAEVVVTQPFVVHR